MVKIARLLVVIVVFGFVLYGLTRYFTAQSPEYEAVGVESVIDDSSEFALEIRNKGWIVYCARGDNGTWDLFASRPDGSSRQNVSNTPDYEEAGPSFSQDGERLLFRRLKKGTLINHDLWGFQGQLMLADADGSNAAPFGEEAEYAWASWSPDRKQLLCLTRKEIQIVDVATKEVVRSLPRNGIYQQLFWSPDGQWFTGTGNVAGKQWSVVRMNAGTGEINPIITFQSCTPDWIPHSNRIIFSSRPAGQSDIHPTGWTQLYAADGAGKQVDLLYGEDGYHIYGGATSPDQEYVIFTKCDLDGGGSEKAGAPMCVMSMSDAPAIGGVSPYLQQQFPSANAAEILTIGTGWEPVWTYKEVFSN